MDSGTSFVAFVAGIACVETVVLIAAAVSPDVTRWRARRAARIAPNAPADDLGAHAAPVVYGPRHQTFIANYVASLTGQGYDAEAARREAQQIVTEHLDYPGFP